MDFGDLQKPHEGSDEEVYEGLDEELDGELDEGLDEELDGELYEELDDLCELRITVALIFAFF